jgi:serine/arginine repetitive matrix protein 2
LQVAHQGLVQAVKSRNYALPSSLSPFPSSSSSTVVLQDAVGKIDEQYALWWEYAELLVELGGGPSTEDPVDSKDSKPPAPTTTTMTTQGHPPKNRERAITLAGASSSSTPFMVPPDTSNKRSKSPPRATPAQWRASTGRHDLSQRQLTLLKEMLVGNPEDNISRTLPPDRSSGRLSPIPKPASQSAVTLPSSVISSDPSATPIKPPSSSKNALPVPQSPHAEGKIRRASRAGFMGIRDILKSFNKKSGAESATAAGSNQSQSSVTSSSVDDHGRPRTPANLPPLPVSPPPPLPTMTSLPPLNAEHAQRKRRGKGSTDVVAVIQQHPNSPYNNTNPRKSPRRPSLASIFRLGQANSNLSNLPTKKKSRSRGREAGKRGAKSSTTENETEAEEEYSDWDRMDSASDIDLSLRALGAGGGQEKDEATVKGRKRFVPKNPPPLPLLSSASQVSLSKLQASPSKPPRPKSQSQSRGLPPPALLNNNQSTPRASQQPHQTQPVQSVAPPLPLPDPRLALTPENIKPLLEYARQVSARLNDCVEELRALGVVEVTSTGGMS